MGSGTFPPSSLSLGQQQQKQHYHAILPENASEFFSNNIPAGLLFLLKILLIRSRPFANDRLTLTSLMYKGLLKGNYSARDLFPKQKYTQWGKSVN